MLQRLRKKPELLAPAGDLEKLQFAIRYGADAVYIGGQQFGLRAKAGNFSFEDMRKGVQFAHERGAKVFVAANIIAHNEDLNGLEDYLKTLEDIGIDAIIVADPAIIETAKRVTPGLEIHLSTQSSTTNWQSVKFWKNEGIARVVLAREVSMEEIREIKQNVDVEIEAFIHGAMCISYSGRCVLSNHMAARDANRGGCTQSCRWKYDLFEEIPDESSISSRPLFMEGDEAYTMGSKDLCMLEHLPDMIEAGVDSLKIEGRMKSIHYVATVVNAYRKAIDAYFEDPENYQCKQEWLDEIWKAAHRPLTTAFFYGKPNQDDQIFGIGPKIKKYDFAALVTDYDSETGIATVQQRNHFQLGQEVEFFGPNSHHQQSIEAMWDEHNEPLEIARHALQTIRIRVNQPVDMYDIMRKGV